MKFIQEAGRRSLRKESFIEIYTQYARYVYCIIYNIVGLSPETDDLFQEIWLNIYRSFEKFESRSKISTWIFGVARNTILTKLRGKREYIDIEKVHVASSDSPERNEKLGILDLVRGLSEEHQEVINLHYVMDLNYEEIAKKLGIPVSTVRSRLFEARKLLKERLEREEVRNNG